MEKNKEKDKDKKPNPSPIPTPQPVPVPTPKPPVKPPVKQTFAKDEPKVKQHLEAQINKKAKPFVNVDTSVQYRYVCPACTGVAFKSQDKRTGPTTMMCASCNRTIGRLDLENYIKI